MDRVLNAAAVSTLLTLLYFLFLMRAGFLGAGTIRALFMMRWELRTRC